MNLDQLSVDELIAHHRGLRRRARKIRRALEREKGRRLGFLDELFTLPEERDAGHMGWTSQSRDYQIRPRCSKRLSAKPHATPIEP